MFFMSLFKKNIIKKEQIYKKLKYEFVAGINNKYIIYKIFKTISFMPKNLVQIIYQSSTT